jgi:hypothetical protein
MLSGKHVLDREAMDTLRIKMQLQEDRSDVRLQIITSDP